MTAHAIQTGKPLILCVDDSESQLWLRAKVLEKNGFSVLTASTAAKALQWMRQAAVSLVLSDHMLGGITGTELAAEVKKVSSNVPVVLYSGAPPPTMQNVDCFILKGESVEKFLAIIRDLVNRHSR
jgi:DNA-binding NtrC family response regulator